MNEREWSAEDTRICEAAVASGKAVNIATGKPMTFRELESLHEEYGSVRGKIDGEKFIREKVRAVPFGNRTP